MFDWKNLNNIDTDSRGFIWDDGNTLELNSGDGRTT
jgi:hypothetical protein